MNVTRYWTTELSVNLLLWLLAAIVIININIIIV
jgi:hypothetical protein